MPKLFKNKTLKSKLENYQIPDFEDKLGIVKKWHEALKYVKHNREKHGLPPLDKGACFLVHVNSDVKKIITTRGNWTFLSEMSVRFSSYLSWLLDNQRPALPKAVCILILSQI